MRRAFAAVIGTIAALVVLLGYKSSSLPARRKQVTLGPSDSTAPTSTPTTQPTTMPEGASPTTSSPPAAAPKSVTGPDVPNRYGDVQVQVKVQGTRIVDVIALQLPQDRQRSAEISQQAGPLLRQEVLDAQSAQIDIVSGATYTSDSYAQSVQAALDIARR
jgi:uncharacterized protein with FMN-binding domain